MSLAQSFEDELCALLPRLRRFAHGLSRSPADADDPDGRPVGILDRLRVERAHRPRRRVARIREQRLLGLLPLVLVTWGLSKLFKIWLGRRTPAKNPPHWRTTVIVSRVAVVGLSLVLLSSLLNFNHHGNAWRRAFEASGAHWAKASQPHNYKVNGFLGGEWNEYKGYVAVRAGDVVFHCSGSMPSSELVVVARCGAHAASIHPLKTFADPRDAVLSLKQISIGFAPGIKQAEAQASIARTNLQRSRELLAQGFVSQSAVDQNAAALEVAEAELAVRVLG